MKAYTYKKAGGPEVLKLIDAPKPQPQPDQLQVKVYAAPVNTGDTVIRKTPAIFIRMTGGFPNSKPYILGMYFAGVVEAVGSEVTKFQPGDKVYGGLGMNFGAYAEYVCISENNPVLLKPEIYSYEEAAAVMFGATTACHFLGKASIKEAKNVLINAAAGAVGTAAVQIAKYYGATITGVCSKRNFDLVDDLGADHLIDYRENDFTENGKEYDIIYDTIGNLNFRKVRKSLVPTGRFVTNAAQSQDYIARLLFRKKIILGFSGDDNLGEVNEIATGGKLKSVIDTIYPFSDMQAAHAKTDSREKVGNIVVKVAQSI